MLFRLIPSSESQITFENQLSPTEELNMYTFKNYFNGGGAAIGDINNDGLQDIYFTGNQVANKLYINLGDWKFQDITRAAGVGCDGVWSTGASFIDINADGWLDLYVCKSGPLEAKGVRHNELFINNGDNTFTEKSQEYGLDFTGLGVHAIFFDYDKDQDVDCYLLNNSIRSIGGYDLIKDQRNIPGENGNKLLRNDNGNFVDVSREAGIYNSDIGFGLGVTVGDINQDGWEDMYVSNDFFERDYLYLNNHDGTFSEKLEDFFGEISLSSMGADFQDINNDAFPDLFVTDMLPERLDRYRTKTPFQSWKRYLLQLKKGYHRQFGRNTLQLNYFGKGFQEIGRYANVPATDWSWGALIFDMDNDGWKDIFVANGIAKDLTDMDYVNFYSDRKLVQKTMQSQNSTLILTLMEEMPSEKLANYAFLNYSASGSVQFSSVANEIGLSDISFSNGSAYADLDNDGDLDLVVNNVNDIAFVYENTSENNYIKLELKKQNGLPALGARISVFADNMIQYQEVSPYRGFQSCVDIRPNFGLGKCSIIDSIVVEWPNQLSSRLYAVSTDTLITIHEPSKENNENIQSPKPSISPIFSLSNTKQSFLHIDEPSSAFDREPLLLRTRSKEGPKLATADLNNDNRTDLYLPGSQNIPGKILLNKGSYFEEIFDPQIGINISANEVTARFFDANGDGYQDLYIGNGIVNDGNNATNYRDKLFINNGDMTYKLSGNRFSEDPTSVVLSEDVDDDGDMDLLVGKRQSARGFGHEAPPEIWLNQSNGEFTLDKGWSESIGYVGFVTDMKLHDLNSDGKKDLIIIGEWGKPVIYINEGHKFVAHQDFTPDIFGFWNTMEIADLDQDGDPDIVLGNWGMNGFLKADHDHPLQLFVQDIDANGSVETLVTHRKGNKDYTYALRNDLVEQVPSLRKKFLKYRDFQDATIEDIIGEKAESDYFVNELRSGWLENRDGRYVFHPFSMQAQLAPVFAVIVADFDDDGNKEVILGGNYHECKPQLGIHDAGNGVMYRFVDGKSNLVPAPESGILFDGEVRDFKIITENDNRFLVVIYNNQFSQIYNY